MGVLDSNTLAGIATPITAIGTEWIALSHRVVTATGAEQVLPIPRIANVIEIAPEADIRYSIGGRTEDATGGSPMVESLTPYRIYLSPGTPVSLFATVGTKIHLSCSYQWTSAQQLVLLEQFVHRKSFSIATVGYHRSQYGAYAWKASDSNWQVSGSSGQKHYGLRPVSSNADNRFYATLPAAKAPGLTVPGRIWGQFEMGTIGDGGIYLRGNAASNHGHFVRLYDSNHATYPDTIRVVTRTAGTETLIGSAITSAGLTANTTVDIDLEINPDTDSMYVYVNGVYKDAFSLTSGYQSYTEFGLGCFVSSATAAARCVALAVTVGG